MNNYRNNKNNNHNNFRAANYVWRVEWYPSSWAGPKKYKAFTNKQRALIFKTSLESQGAHCVYLQKYTG